MQTSFSAPNCLWVLASVLSRTKAALSMLCRSGSGSLRHQLADLADGRCHQFAAGGREQVGQLADAGRDLAPRLGVFRIQAVQVILQNGNRGFLVAAFQQYLDELAHVARRHAGRFMRQQHALLAGFRHFRPEHAVQDVGMRLHQNAGLAHLVFLELRIWRSVSICRLMCSIIWCTALTFTSPFWKRSRAKRMAMCSAAFISSGVLSVCSADVGLRRQASQQLLQIEFGVGVNRGQFFLQMLVVSALGSPPTSPNRVSRRMA